MDAKDITKKWEEIEKALNESTKELYGNKGWKPTTPPLHKNAKVKTGEEGVLKAVDEFDASKKMETVPTNKNKEGAEVAAEEFDGSKKSAGEQDGKTEEEGAEGGANIAKKGYCATSFRNKVRGIYGLSLNDKLNKPNAGKQGLNEEEELTNLDGASENTNHENTLKTLAANVERAISDNETVTIAGGQFNKEELQVLLNCINTTLGTHNNS